MRGVESLLDIGLVGAGDLAEHLTGDGSAVLEVPAGVRGDLPEGQRGKLFAADDPLTPEEFRQVVADNLTHHFRVSRRASLYDDCQLVLTSPDVPMGDKSPAFALANFIKTTLHAFTATLAVENERLVHDVPVNQINLTRRVQSEEPRDLDEHLEEVRRFARAVLLVGAPLPDAEDSRYRARIYRGMSMTV